MGGRPRRASNASTISRSNDAANCGALPGFSLGSGDIIDCSEGVTGAQGTRTTIHDDGWIHADRDRETRAVHCAQHSSAAGQPKYRCRRSVVAHAGKPCIRTPLLGSMIPPRRNPCTVHALRHPFVASRCQQGVCVVHTADAGNYNGATRARKVEVGSLSWRARFITSPPFSMAHVTCPFCAAPSPLGTRDCSTCGSPLPHLPTTRSEAHKASDTAPSVTRDVRVEDDGSNEEPQISPSVPTTSE